jgi:hypothetical protein
MKYFTNILVIGCILLAGQGGLGQDRSTPSMIQLLANPEKFDGKVVTLIGFLTLDHQKHHAAMGFLSLHEEDAKNLLSNAVMVVPSEQMLRDEEKIQGMYVIITGLLRLVPGTNDSHGMVIKDVQTCRAWSDPRRPIGLKDDIQSTDKK